MKKYFHSARFATLAMALLATGLVGTAQAQVGPAGVSTGIQTWLDASDLSTSSTTVAVWADKSGSGHPAQAPVGEAAQYTASSINGKPALSFTGSQAYTLNGLDIRAINMPDITVFTVYKEGLNGKNPLWGNDNGNWDRFVYSYFDGVQSGLISVGGGGYVTFAGGTTVGNSYLSTAVYDGQVVGIYNQAPANGSSVSINGLEVKKFTDFTDPTDAKIMLSLGSDGDNKGFIGQIAEFIVYNRKLSDCEMKAVNSYLNTKYTLGMDASTLGTSLAAPTFAIVPGNGPYTGGDVTKYYLGYGPQTATLTASSPDATSYTWTINHVPAPSGATQTFTASTAGTFVYTVTATNASGCSSSASITLTVIDANCDKNKVAICHNGNAICIAAAAVDAHLRNHPGDQLGACSPGAPGAGLMAAAPAPTLSSALATYPNPATEQATITFQATRDGHAQVVVYDRMGQLVATLYDGSVEEGQLFTLPLNSNRMTSGLYQCRLVMNGKAESIQLQVQR